MKRDERKKAYFRTSGARAFLVALILLLGGSFAATGSAQSLAELAKKEKKRRAEIASSEQSQAVITERELQRSYGGLPATPAPAATEETEGEQGTPPTAEGQPAAGQSQADAQEDESKTREYWEKRVSGVREKIQKLETELNAPETNWGEGLRQDINPLGQRNLERRQQLEQELAKARSELAAIQDEARRAGVPPGWVR